MALSKKLGLYEPAIESWLSAALAFGYLTKTGSRFSLDKKMAEILLDPASDEFLGGQFSYLALQSLQYSKMDQLFLRGKASPHVQSFEAIDAATEWDHEAFLRAIENDGKLSSLLGRGCNLLDVGCGTGRLLEKLVEKYPRSRFTGIDTSREAIRLAKKRLRNSVTLHLLSGCSMDFADEYDIVFCGEVLYSVVEKTKFLSKCRTALSRSGVIILIEGLIPPSDSQSVEEEDILIYGMQIDFALQGARFFYEQEIGGLLNRARFGNVNLKNLGGRLFMVTATK